MTAAHKSWRLDHDPDKRPNGCNGKPGDSGRNRHGKGEPADQWVTLTLADFAALLSGNRDHITELEEA